MESFPRLCGHRFQAASAGRGARGRLKRGGFTFPLARQCGAGDGLQMTGRGVYRHRDFFGGGGVKALLRAGEVLALEGLSIYDGVRK